MRFLTSFAKEPKAYTFNKIFYENSSITEIHDAYTMDVLVSILDEILENSIDSYISMPYSKLPEYYDVELKIGTSVYNIHNDNKSDIKCCAEILSYMNAQGIFPVLGYYDMYVMDLLDSVAFNNSDADINRILYPENMSMYDWCLLGYTCENQINCLRRNAKDKEDIGLSLENQNSIELSLLDAQARIEIKYAPEEFSNVHGILLFDNIHNEDMKHIMKFSEKFPNIQCIVYLSEAPNEKLVQ